jgi:hypothetical protein
MNFDRINRIDRIEETWKSARVRVNFAKLATAPLPDGRGSKGDVRGSRLVCFHIP